ncbi:hypothetical protein RRG08_016844 [Elysia crispata]|uniref:Uncharacterized protein n=1 Tax=Elysia crispata TaxID=231223 RepID=A0AAE1CIT7_9GAST|nr:hypothetical protein RRG08_016844 [Elysia crispata]
MSENVEVRSGEISVEDSKVRAGRWELEHSVHDELKHRIGTTCRVSETWGLEPPVESLKHGAWNLALRMNMRVVKLELEPTVGDSAEI